MLSILIPTYNYNITRLVSDLHRQAEESYADFEIIVMEDGSTRFLEENKKVAGLKFCKYIVLSENVGRSKIRNKLAREARYDYLLFLDCDAAIPHPNFINKYLVFCKGEAVVLGGRMYDEKHEPEYSLIKKYGRQRERNNTANEISRKKHPMFTTPNFLISKNIFNTINFDENIEGYGHEDTIFGIELTRLGIEYIFIDNPVIHKGLEKNVVFLTKTRKAIDNLYALYASGKYSELEQDSKLLKTFLRIKSRKKLFSFLFTLSRKVLEKNLISKNPSLNAFDIYKLLYLCKTAVKK